MTDQWFIGRDNEENFSLAGDSRREAVFEARERIQANGGGKYFIARGSEYRPTVDGQSVIDQACEHAYDVAYEASESWLDSVSKPQVKELSKRLTRVFREWLRETGNMPHFYPLVIEREVS